MQAHLDTEKYLAESASSTAGTPFTWTSIREGIYAETWPMYTGFPDISQAVIEGRIPHDWCGAGVPWVKRNDLGEGSARLIQQYVEAPADFAYVNKVMLLTGTKNWNLGDTLKAVGKLLGKKVQLYHESEQAYAKRDAVVIAMQTPGLEDLNVPKEWATVFEAIRKGETSVVSPDLKRLLGREPADFESILRALLPKSN